MSSGENAVNMYLTMHPIPSCPGGVILSSIQDRAKYEITLGLQAGVDRLSAKRPKSHFTLYFFTTFGLVYSNPSECQPQEHAEHFWHGIRPTLELLNSDHREGSFITVNDAVIIRTGMPTKILMPRLLLFVDDIKAISMGEIDRDPGIFDTLTDPNH